MSENYIHKVTYEDVYVHDPTLVGNSKWECADDTTYTYKSDEWAEEEIAKALIRIAQIEAIRRARVEYDLIAIVDRAEELCRVMYGQDLATFEVHSGQKFTRGLYRVAQHLVEEEQKGSES